MTALGDSLEEYLRVRRSVGYKLVLPGWLLSDFVAFCDTEHAVSITTDLALRWATLPSQASSGWWRTRLSAVRVFARYLSVIDPATQVPPPDLLPGRTTRVRPYLFRTADIDALLAAAGALTPALWAATMRTLIGLLASTGMRVGEALALGREDVRLEDGVIRIFHAKGGQSRDVPLHPSTVAALATYALYRDAAEPSAPASTFLVSRAGGRLTYPAVSTAFAGLRRTIGLVDPGRRNPRLHDLRHHFAVVTLLDFYASGRDIAPMLPLLSTYLGHVNPASTYWYLQACPELMAAAAARLSMFSAVPS